MIGADLEGVKAVRAEKPTRMDNYSPGLDELTGIPGSERDGAIVALHFRCRWSPVRLAGLFSLSERQVFRVLSDFRDQFGGEE